MNLFLPFHRQNVHFHLVSPAEASTWSEIIEKQQNDVRPISLKSDPKCRSITSADSSGSLKDQSEMTLNRMTPDPNNAMELFGSDFNKIDVRPAKTQISLGIRPVW